HEGALRGGQSWVGSVIAGSDMGKKRGPATRSRQVEGGNVQEAAWPKRRCAPTLRSVHRSTQGLLGAAQKSREHVAGRSHAHARRLGSAGSFVGHCTKGESRQFRLLGLR